MKKLVASKYGWIILTIAFIAIVYASLFVSYRIDLTAEKRFSLTNSTEKLVKKLDSQVTIDVYLTGNLTAGLKKVANSVDETLQQYRNFASGNIAIHYIDPFAIEDDSLKGHLLDSLKRYGLTPFTQVAQEKKGAEQSQRFVIPGALVTSVNGTYPINFLKGAGNSGDEGYYNNIESLLEYKFSSAIEKVTRKTIPHIAYALGNGESLGYDASEAIFTLASDYKLDSFNLKTNPIIPQDIECLVLLQPTTVFTESDKFKIDQYLLHGGTILLATDVLTASLDSLNLKPQTVAFDKGLDIYDLLFKYGVRINPDLVQDYQATDISLVVGSVGGKPQNQLLKWPYYPLVSGNNAHPISKNLDPVFGKYVNSIDTVKAEGITKTILLATSQNGKKIGTPAMISFESLKYADDIKEFTEPNIPVAVLLEGKFKSLFANRLSAATLDSLQKANSPFLPKGDKAGKLIVISDGDMFLNELTQKGPLPIGFNKYTNYTFANRDFMLNCMDFLVGKNGIFESRNKDFTLRLLNKEKVEADYTKWQLINIVGPIIIVIIIGLMLQWLRKRKYAV
ncbi:gliding motility-associated ABC transporter substrate-binding protein GldG [Parasediminibacterium paludis]|uniref:Gliding motility-associated ABC transporter substrate-binding protein GldG n=1 Tax=Parasediminibacterium paludis TaxID=908966 RepID=A0ABV8PYG7_9BACT